MYLLFLLFLSITAYSFENLEEIGVQSDLMSDDLIGAWAENIPLSSKTIQSQQIQSNRIRTVKDTTLIDASVSENYSGSGYWDSVNIRGFAVDNRRNYFRDGLRINAQTYIAVENKEAIEIAKGLGAFQGSLTGSSGSINLRTKKAKAIKNLNLEYSERGGTLAHLDWGKEHKKFAYRINLVQENIKSKFDNNDGNRNLLALASSYKLDSKSLVEFDIEWARRSQTSLAAQSLWGTKIPSPKQSLNLNNQSWAKPVEFESLFYSLKYTRELPLEWLMTINIGRQDSKTNDRMSYPYGCSHENSWTSYCSNGDFDVYDFRSEDEKRITDSARLSFSKYIPGVISHEISINTRYTVLKENMNSQAYNFVGIGSQRRTNLTPNNFRGDASRNLKESDLEIFAVDKMSLGNWGMWIGGNFQFSNRSSVKTDGTERNDFNERYFVPWISITRKLNDALLYISYAQGKESWLTPNRSNYSRPGQLLAQVTSHQYELGYKSKFLNSSIFYMKRPSLLDLAPKYKQDGSLQQWGSELSLSYSNSTLRQDLSLMYLNINQVSGQYSGKKLPNIPSFLLRYLSTYSLGDTVIGVRSQFESKRFVNHVNSTSIPSWIRWDVYVERKIGNSKLRIFVDNIFDKNHWKESPVQYGHNYLYQGMGRRVGLQSEWTF